MLGRRPLFAVALLLVSVVPAAAAPEVLDLVPDDAAFGVVVRNIGDLKKKGDKFFASAGLKDSWLPPPSTMIKELTDSLDLKAGIDENASAAAILMFPKGTRLKEINSPEPFIVLAIPFKDRDKMAGNFNMKGDDLKEGKIFARNLPAGPKFFGSQLCVHNNHLLVGNSAKTIETVLKSAKSASRFLAADQRKSLTNADLLISFQPEFFGDDWNEALGELQKHLAEKATDAERQMAVDLIAALKTIRLGVAAVRFDDGLGVSLAAVFPEKVPEATRKFLASLAGGRTGTDLKGLPEGPAIFASASKGEGRQNGRLLKVLTDLVLRDALEKVEWLPSPTDRANVLAAFSEIMKRLDAYRIAVYQNPDQIKHGLLSAVAILDTADGEKFIADMKLLARLSGTEGLDLSAKGSKDDRAVVEKLIRDLGDDDFEVRDSATNRLRLIGEPALPLLEKALKSKDAEVRRLAEEIKSTIIVTAVARRKDLLSKEAPWRLRPTFRFEAKPEERDGRKIETARVRLTEKDAPAADALRSVFGPDWDRVRVVAQGKQVVVLLGSDEKLLDTALANLKDGKPGLAGAKSLAAYAQQADPSRKLELHGSTGAVLALLRGEDLRRPKATNAPSLTSASVAVGPDRLRLDFWLPSSELEALIKISQP